LGRCPKRKTNSGGFNKYQLTKRFSPEDNNSIEQCYLKLKLYEITTLVFSVPIHLMVKNIAERKSAGPGFPLLLQTLKVHSVVTKIRDVILSQMSLPYIVGL
jgi:hypothetical protein